MFICEEHSEKWNRDTGCPYCREIGLEAELAELREALEEIATSDHLGNRWAQSKARAALQEKGE